MTRLKDIKIYIVDLNIYTCNQLQKYLFDVPNITIICDGIENFYNNHTKEIDCLVSPANSFGLMTGGYDAGLSNILGWDFQYKVQDYIKNNFYGEQGVATSFILKTNIPNLSLIHTPTMRFPSIIIDDMIVYYCMRSTLICALKNDIRCIVIPVFGGATGRVNPVVASKRLRDAYMQILNWEKNNES